MLYDVKSFRERMKQQGFNPYRLAQAAQVDPKTVQGLLRRGTGQSEKVFRIAHTLGFPVRRYGPDRTPRYDFTSILIKRPA